MRLIEKNGKWILKEISSNLIAGPFRTREDAINFYNLYLNNRILIEG